jgi:hypothetical protein
VLKFALKSLIVFSEIFILPGTNVCIERLGFRHIFNLFISSRSLVRAKVLGQVRVSCNGTLLGYSIGHLVVTGASDGIGREYAIQLAKKGFNVLAVARNEPVLTAVTDEIGELGRIYVNTL